jgi:polyisoprenoid-binding protein YceI
MPYRLMLLALLSLFVIACGGQNTPAAVENTPALPTRAVPVLQGMRIFAVVPGESTASYIVDEEFFQGALEKYGIALGKQKITGSTDRVNGVLQLNVTTAELGTAEFTVDLPSLITGRDERDNWIRDNALESNRYPMATFLASEVRNPPAGYDEGQEVTFQLAGDITIRQTTLPVVWDVTASLAGNTIRGVAETRLKMTDFGITPPSFAGTLTVQDDFSVRVDFVAREQ